MSRFGIFNTLIQSSPGETHCLGAYMEAGSIEESHEFTKSFPFFVPGIWPAQNRRNRAIAFGQPPA